ncbi:MAG: helix-turn-helix domain-containing protein [Ardenticatenaceae bacterium]|nr:helix-turn-helix domain-containing protein [Ardenticatenaceae bacterium]
MSDDVNDKNSLISLGDAAEIFGFSADYLRNLAQRNRLKAQKIGGIWLTTRANVEEYIESRQKRGAYRDDIDSESN